MGPALQAFIVPRAFIVRAVEDAGPYEIVPGEYPQGGSFPNVWQGQIVNFSCGAYGGIAKRRGAW